MLSYPRAISFAAAATVATSCLTRDRAGESEVVASLHPPTWFEDGWSYYDVSPNETEALFGARFGQRLIELAGGREAANKYRGPLAEVRGAVFGPDGRLVRQGSSKGESGWFEEGEHGPLPAAIPPDAVPRWSPDGSSVAYYRGSEPRLFVGSAGDPSDYELAGPVTGVAWSPESDLVYALVVGPDGLSSLVRVSTGTNNISVVKDSLDATNRFNSIGVVPGGQYVYIALPGEGPPDPEARHQPDADRDMDIYRLETETGHLTRVVGEPGDDFYPQVVGSNLYWTQNEIRDEVVVLPLAGGDARAVVDHAQIPYWSNDGKKLAFTYGGWRISDWGLNLDAGVVDVDADGRRQSDPMPIVQGYHEDFTPAWSPDGSWIAFHSHRAADPVSFYASQGASDDIYLRRPSAPNEDEIRLTDFGWEVGMADWSPDGTRLVFDSWDRRGTPGMAHPWIATIDTATGHLLHADRLPLPDGFHGTLLAAWSPVDERIALIERIAGERQALWTLNADGGDPKKLLEFESSTYGGVDWTPDGATIIYGALAGGSMQLFAIASSGGQPRQLTHDPVSLLHPQVSPDGRLVAATRIHRSKELRRMPLGSQ